MYILPNVISYGSECAESKLITCRRERDRERTHVRNHLVEPRDREIDSYREREREREREGGGAERNGDENACQRPEGSERKGREKGTEEGKRSREQDTQANK